MLDKEIYTKIISWITQTIDLTNYTSCFNTICSTKKIIVLELYRKSQTIKFKQLYKSVFINICALCYLKSDLFMST